MTDSNNPVDINDNLEAFEQEFYGTDNEVSEQEEVVEEVDESEEEASEEEVVEAEDDSLATDDEDEEDDAEEEEEDDEEESEPEPKPKPKSKAQQRIEQLLERERLANERATALEKRLEALEAGKKEAPKEEKPVQGEKGPEPDAVGEDGEPVYPLGEFDPQYIRDLTRFTITEERKAAKAADEQEAAQREQQTAEQALIQSYTDKVAEVEKELPDLREKLTEAAELFEQAEPAHGEYLAQVIMASDYGPQIMYYLSQNIGEAQKIVASGPVAATLALGRIEAQLTARKEEPKRNKKVSGAPTPPSDRVRGNQGRFSVNPDTDDLNAFEKVFFKGN